MYKVQRALIAEMQKVGLYILHGLCAKYGKDSIGLNRDDGLAVFRNISGPTAERIKKNITRHFKIHRINITIQTNMKTVNYLDVTFNLNSGFIKATRQPILYSYIYIYINIYIYIYIYICIYINIYLYIT